MLGIVFLRGVRFGLGLDAETPSLRNSPQMAAQLVRWDYVAAQTHESSLETNHGPAANQTVRFEIRCEIP